MITEILLSANGLTALLVLLILTLMWLDTRRPSDLPPGPPIRVPILGHLPELGPKTLLQKLKEYRRKYGDVFSLKMGSKWWIVFNGYDTLRDAFVKNGDVFSSRPDLFIFREMAGFRGIVASSGSLWKEQRTFALSKLREFGFGKRTIETNVLEEVKQLITNMQEQNGKSFDIYNILHACISNVTCSIVFGKRFEHTDPVFMKILSMFQEHLRSAGASSAMVWLPFLKYLPDWLSGRQKVLDNIYEIEKFMGNIIDEHWETFDENNKRDFIDIFIAEKKKHDNNKYSTFTDSQLQRVIFEFFVAGTETTATTIRWAIVYLIRNPDVQDKMRAEIEYVVGRSQFPRMQHRQDMPYTDAVITEVQRCGNIAPLSIFHGTDKDAIFRGFRIPKDAILTPNLDSVLIDEFEEPYKFNPSRFIDSNGKYNANEKVIPFSIGRRVCLGESLARMELFLFLTAMVQRFRFMSEKGKPAPSEEPILGITRSPHEYKFCPVPV